MKTRHQIRSKSYYQLIDFNSLYHLDQKSQKRLREVAKRKDGKFRTGHQQKGETLQLMLIIKHILLFQLLQGMIMTQTKQRMKSMRLFKEQSWMKRRAM
jgi:hypothetical protein